MRIISGRWRGRRLPVAAVPGLRPTPDRVRETLFNWLQPVLPGAVCLDLFAGSGALGLEAASRGALRVVMVERDRRLAQHLRQQTRELEAEDTVAVQSGDGLAYLARCDEAFDLVFLDPPYGLDLLPGCIARLSRPGCLRPGARIYLEHAGDAAPPALPEGWSVLRHTGAGAVAGLLVAVDGE
ncbi:16S rRNA (guanine(966)-N(2))-methyltransferase RsmD [Ectothiorhodospira mobilis]|uniref:16S rRNA (guanine(966)-N(2))-methyltransferase RsmD n=1 Tax=Ectothiorhodospira mobilis TaxID=195064 RepID=UPI001907B6D0|nr:16S rRNA (guanine(966)-N(2))-methyltransferase RsmD [Ectothiorhodospira mobilis]